MTGPAPLLDFFVLEAGECIEQIDALLARGSGPSGPDAAALQRLARALRGSATMAKLSAFADVASGLERLGRALQDNTLHWEPGLAGAMIAAVDDLKIMVRSARNWTPADADRAKARATELARYVPVTLSSAPTPIMASGLPFFASEATNIAAGIELLATRPGDRDTAVQVLKRVRALRGVAGIKDVSALAEVLDSAEDVATGLERGEKPLSPQGESLLKAAAGLLRRIAAELRDGTPSNAETHERAAFAIAVEQWFEQEAEDEPVVPIADLFYGDSGPHVVTTAEHPPTSSGARFRLELVSSGEHLRQLVRSARERPIEAQPRARRELRRSLRSVAGLARSFGDRRSAELLDDFANDLGANEQIDLDRLDAVAEALANPGADGEQLFAKIGLQPTPAATPTVQSLPTAPPIVAPSPPTQRAVTSLPEAPPVAASSAARWPASPAPVDQINAGIAALERLSEHPLAAPVAIPQSEIVAIETLLYRGQGALKRAIEVRDELRQAPAPPPGALDELYDLLDLALAE